MIQHRDPGDEQPEPTNPPPACPFCGREMVATVSPASTWTLWRCPANGSAGHPQDVAIMLPPTVVSGG